MPVSLNQFSDIAARQNVRDSGIVRVDSRQDLKLNQSRFRLVRWVRDSGIGKRLSNRNTINTFISSLQNHYDEEVTSRMDFRPLRELRTRGKPLHVRDIKAAISEAEMVADGVKLVKSSNIEGLVDENIAGVAYKALPGGEDLAREVRSKVDIAATQEELGLAQSYRAGRGNLSGDYSILTAKRLVSLAVNDAQKDVFLTGYGIKTAQGLKYDKLQKLINEHPQIESLNVHYGISFDASRASRALYRALSEKLENKLHETMRKPEQLPGEGSVKERVEQAISQSADRVVDEFIQERAVALERLSKLHADGEISSADMALFGKGGHQSLVDVVLHHRIPPDMISALYALRSEMPDDLGVLVSSNHPMEDKIGVLGQLGEVVEGIFKEISVADRRKYSAGTDSKLNFIYDCGRFLLEGKLSGDAESTIRHAVKTDSPGSDLLELCQGIAAMRGGMNEPGANSDHWAAARDPLNSMSMATVALLGPDAPPLIGEYTPLAGNVLNAMRNCGIDAPPPGNYRVEQSGRGTFSRPAMEIALKELEEDLDRSRIESPDFPGFPEEAIKDFNRAEFVINGRTIARGDVDGIVEGLRNICKDRDNNPDERMLEIVGQLVYQRTNHLAYGRFTFGGNFGGEDSVSMLKTAPFVGNPAVAFETTYDVSRDTDNNVLMRIRSAGPAGHLQFDDSQGQQYLDRDQSNLGFDVHLEIDARDYSVKVTSMNYEYRLVPTDKEP